MTNGQMAAKRTVAIFSNYAATEKTLCAMYLAAHILRRYRYVAWIVPEDTTQRSKSDAKFLRLQISLSLSPPSPLCHRIVWR